MNHTPPISSLRNTENTINIKKYVYLLLSNWYWIVASIIVSLGAAYLKNRYAENYYEAAATIIFEKNNIQQDAIMQIKAFRSMRNQTELMNEKAKLKSYRLSKRTIDKLKTFDLFFVGYGRIREMPMYKEHVPFAVEYDTSFLQRFNLPVFLTFINDEKLKLSIPDEGKFDTILNFGDMFENRDFRFKIVKKQDELQGYQKYSFTFHDPEMLANAYRNKLEVIVNEREMGTIMFLKIQDKVSQRAVDYLNTLCEEYISYDLEWKNQIAKNTLGFLDEQLSIITDSLQRIERNMLRFMMNEKVYDLSKQGNIAFDQLQGYHADIIQLQFKQKYYEYILDFLKKDKVAGDLMVPSVVNINDAILEKLVNSLMELLLQKQDLAFSANEDNPTYQKLVFKIASNKKQLEENIQSLIEKNRLELNKLEDEVAQVNKVIRNIPSNERELYKIKQSYNVNNDFYTFLLERRAEVGIQKASNMPESRVLDPAELNQLSKKGANKRLNYLIFLFLGLFIPGAVIIINDFFNGKINTKEDIEMATSIPIIGIIGNSPEDAEIPVYENPKAIISESFRRIRTNLQYILRDNDQKVIMITSTISGEGKTFITLNLAAIIALAGKKVALLGMDLRRPKLHKVFNVDNSKGLSTYLIGKHTIEDVLVPLNIKNLYLFPSGPIPPNPAELLETEKMNELFRYCREHFDYVLIDTPPIALVSDALQISGFSDANLFILRHKYTHRNVLELLNMLNNEQKFKNLNILINDLKISRFVGYKYYYGYNYYSYGYGYYSKKNYGYYSLDEKD